MDNSDYDLGLLFRSRNGCNAIIILKTIISVLAMITAFDDNKDG